MPSSCCPPQHRHSLVIPGVQISTLTDEKVHYRLMPSSYCPQNAPTSSLSLTFKSASLSIRRLTTASRHPLSAPLIPSSCYPPHHHRSLLSPPVQVSSFIDQQPYHRLMPSPCCSPQHRPYLATSDVRIYAFIDQQPYYRLMPFVCCPVQRRSSTS